MTTVKEAIDQMIRARNVDTGRVSGLSRQIIAQMNTLANGILVSFESLPGIEGSGASLNLYLQTGAKESLRAALREGTAKQPGLKMTINSAYRTVAQQHILYQVFQRDSKLIPLASKPGNSNHENGLAIDVNNYNAWKPYLTAHGWHWLGGNDPVHFSETSGRNDLNKLGIAAFQSLWNQYHPQEPMTVDGNFGAQTAAKMDSAPIGGFGGTSVLHLGDTGTEITRIQQRLANLGYVTAVNGSFDRQTQAAVIKFQTQQGLAADGAIGQMTLKALGIKL
ncbi:peptidoglycan-binding protein [Chamaesiphon sp. VAR_69_metabat_338]|uniref:peptidoglycan-binding protein n=1 Tax=Chamaesiphon sp. VAR_69_metabat_338 TaxID=2964704 RepID=UPI00286E5431|nr:peptidoglycan-binding protein [Chamaesiphon sp. VAR_69_metabat_338]